MTISPGALSKPAILDRIYLEIILLSMIVLPFLLSKLAKWIDKRRE